jgi:serine/threonine protein phosphatase PrpC
MFPGIPISRSLGDFMAHKIGVISEPTTGLVELTKTNDYLVIATSTLWRVMTPKEVFEFIK